MSSSRFALLNPEVDLDERFGKKKDPKNKSESSKKNQNKNLNNNTNNKKKKGDDEKLQNLAFGNPKSKNKKKNKGNSNGNANGSNSHNKENSVHNGSVDEQWKERDQQFVQDINEKALRDAIFASKLDFEENKDLYKANKQEPVETKGKTGKTKKKKDKPLTISLGQFNNLDKNQIKELNGGVPLCTDPFESPEDPEDDTFFEDVEEATRQTLERESKHQTYKATAQEFSSEVKLEEYKKTIEKQDFEIQALRLEVDSLKEQLSQVKNRNKKLCEVISLSEMKTKGELVVELQKANKSHDEFSQEVTRLSAALEQEKTKVSQLQSEHRKTGGKKKHNSESVSKE